MTVDWVKKLMNENQKLIDICGGENCIGGISSLFLCLTSIAVRLRIIFLRR